MVAGAALVVFHCSVLAAWFRDHHRQSCGTASVFGSFFTKISPSHDGVRLKASGGDSRAVRFGLVSLCRICSDSFEDSMAKANYDPRR
jgi:hypothetical protein